jgi:hypothetical protein
MALQVSLPQDQEFKKLLRAALAKPDSWYEERVVRAVRGARDVKRRALRVPSKN